MSGYPEGRQFTRSSVSVKEQALNALKRYFGYDNFRGHQEAAVAAALAGHDSFVLMPTGGGKSLCYTIPALVAHKQLVLVVSPLIALMQDQVASLKSRGIVATYISSNRTGSERSMIMACLENDLDAKKLPACDRPAAFNSVKSKGGLGEGVGACRSHLQMLYITPESLSTDSFQRVLAALSDKGQLCLIAVDEAHCVSSWGHDFRPSYRCIAYIRRRVGKVPFMALTATAALPVRQDIMQQLQLKDPVELVASFNRPNITYSVLLLDAIARQHRIMSRGAAAAAAVPASTATATAAAGVGHGQQAELTQQEKLLRAVHRQQGQEANDASLSPVKDEHGLLAKPEVKQEALPVGVIKEEPIDFDDAAVKCDPYIKPEPGTEDTLGHGVINNTTDHTNCEGVEEEVQAKQETTLAAMNDFDIFAEADQQMGHRSSRGKRSRSSEDDTHSLGNDSDDDDDDTAFSHVKVDAYVDGVAMDQLEKQLLQHIGQGASKGCAVVYVHRRVDAESVAGQIRTRRSLAGIRAAAYHAGICHTDRSAVLQRWMDKQLDVVVATTSFGMGIDRADVRLVVHWCVPQTLEGYYQESGRAGRDGQPAHAVLMYRIEDSRRISWILSKQGGDTGKSVKPREPKKAKTAALTDADKQDAGGRTTQKNKRSTGKGKPARNAGKKGGSSSAGSPGKQLSINQFFGSKGNANGNPQKAGAGSPQQQQHQGAKDGQGQGDGNDGNTKTERHVNPHAHANFQLVVNYACEVKCRRATLLHHFGEVLQPGTCQGCDVCQDMQHARFMATEQGVAQEALAASPFGFLGVGPPGNMVHFASNAWRTKASKDTYGADQMPLEDYEREGGVADNFDDEGAVHPAKENPAEVAAAKRAVETIKRAAAKEAQKKGQTGDIDPLAFLEHAVKHEERMQKRANAGRGGDLFEKLDMKQSSSNAVTKEAPKELKAEDVAACQKVLCSKFAGAACTTALPKEVVEGVAKLVTQHVVQTTAVHLVKGKIRAIAVRLAGKETVASWLEIVNSEALTSLAATQVPADGNTQCMKCCDLTLSQLLLAEVAAIESIIKCIHTGSKTIQNKPVPTTSNVADRLTCLKDVHVTKALVSLGGLGKKVGHISRMNEPATQAIAVAAKKVIDSWGKQVAQEQKKVSDDDDASS